MTGPTPQSLEGLRDAASVVVMRDNPVLEVLLVQRHQKSGFMAGAYVFPGGKVDVADCLPVETLDPAIRQRVEGLDVTPGTCPGSSRKLGFMVAACRELFEEAGLLLGDTEAAFAGQQGNEHAAPLVPFAELLMEVGMGKAIGSLHYFAHWVTPSHEKKRFDTRFFVASAPQGQVAKRDERECVDLRWMPIGEALHAHSQKEIMLPPPTLKILEDLSRFENVAKVIEWTRACVVEALMPKIVLGDKTCPASVILPWDESYNSAPGESLPIHAVDELRKQAGGVSRIELRNGFWKTILGQNAT